MIRKYDNLTAAKKALSNKSYRHKFIFNNGRLLNTESGIRYTADEIMIDEYHRFEIDSQNDEAMIIFALSCSDDTKGIFVPATALFTDKSIMSFFQKVRITNNSGRNSKNNNKRQRSN